MKKFVVAAVIFVLLAGCSLGVSAEDAALGDTDLNGMVNSNDAIYLLRHTLDSDQYPLSQNGDLNGNGSVNSNDAVYLLRHTLAPEAYPLYSEPIKHLSISVREDAQVSNGFDNSKLANTNFGKENEILIVSSRNELVSLGYVKFDVSALVEYNSFTCIELVLPLAACQTSAPASVKLYGASTEWSEGEITFDTRPASFSVICQKDGIASGDTVSFPITDYVRKAINAGKQEVAFYFREATSQAPLELRFASKESGGDVPTLSVSFGTKTDETKYDGAIEEIVLERELVAMDFDTDKTIVEYVSEQVGISPSAGLCGGMIEEGKWIYSNKPLAIKDEMGIFSLDYYSVEFDFCFNSFVNRDITSVFSIITDDDGRLDGNSSFYVPIKMDVNGEIYHNNASTLTVQLKQGKTYHYKIEVNSAQKSVKAYLDGILWVSCAYNQELKNYQCFRLMDVERGANAHFDNFVIKDLSGGINKSTEDKVIAIDAAYLRGAQYADKPQGLAEGKYIDIKHQATVNSVYREGLIKFDISSLKQGGVNYSGFMGSYINMGGDRTFDIYWVDSEWNGETVTYNNAPKGQLVAKDVTFGGMGAPLELSRYIEEALANGDTEFSLKIVPTFQTGDGQTRIYFEGENRPAIQIFKEKPTNNYFYKLVEDEEDNAAIWAWAQKMYDEWYQRYQSLPDVNENAQRIVKDKSQYTKSNYASGNAGNYASTKKRYETRKLEAIVDLDKYVSNEFENAKRDVYGGIMVESLKHRATGYFYTVKIDGRWWMIDPLGYPYINIGLSHINYSLNGSKLQKENALKKYGTFENWALATTRQVMDEFNFNASFSPRAEVRAIENGLPYMAYVSFMGSYGIAKAVRGDGNGSTVFTENNTMPVFDPDFEVFANNLAEDKMTAEVNNSRIIGYTSDNELPMAVAMLDNALAVNHTKLTNLYTYACTWTWLCNITGKENPSYADITDELRDLYRGFVYDRYFYVVSNAIRSVDPNHMYMGCRFLTVSKDSEWVYRFAAQYLDVMTINWYFCWEPETEALYGIERNGDMPFLVSEFYTKAGDSGLPNMSGAGLYVATQTDRADFYENFTLKLLESNNCVGWEHFHYMDNDPNSGTSDASSVDSNKGLYTNDYEVYTVFADRLKVYNANVYKLLEYFQNKNAG